MIPMMRAPLPHMTSMMIMRKWHKTKCHSFTRRSCENGKQPIELKVKSEKWKTLLVCWPDDGVVAGEEEVPGRGGGEDRHGEGGHHGLVVRLGELLQGGVQPGLQLQLVTNKR